MRRVIFLIVALACGGSASRSGYVHILRTSPTSSYSVTGSFIEGTSSLPEYTLTTIGPCLLYTMSGQPNPPAPKKVSAGTLSIAATPSGASYTLGPGSYSLSSAAFAPGDVVSMTASGADVPAFSGSIALPPALSVTNPAVAPGTTTFTLDRATDLAITHSTSASGKFFVQFEQSGALPFASLTCQFPATDANATVPADALGKLATGAATAFFGLRDELDTTAGDAPIALAVDDYFDVTVTVL